MATVSADSTYTFTVTGNRSLMAVFEAIIPTYTITATIDPAGSGTVTGAGQYQEGDTVTLTATVNDGYTFTGWQENGAVVSTDNPYTFTAAGDRAFTAAFAEKPASRLPDGYTEVEYIQANSGAGINTGLYGNTLAKTRWVFDAEPLDNSSSFLLLGSSYSQSASSMFYYFELSGALTTFYARFGPANLSIKDLMRLGRMTIEFNATKYNTAGTTNTQINGAVDEKTFEFTAAKNTYMQYLPNAYIFAANRRTGSTAKQYFAGYAKLYSCKVYDSTSTLLRDFVPCISPSGAVGLYDLVGGQFCGNSGTGTLTAGPAV